MPVTNFLWDEENDSYLAETDGAGAVIAEYTNEPLQYGPLVSQRRGDSANYYHFDGQDSSRQLADSVQNVTDTYTYAAFGESVVRTGTTVNPFRYNGALGYFFTSETVDYYARARCYMPAVGRWISKDPLGLERGINLFAYTLNNPLYWKDPSGLQIIVSLTQVINRCEFGPNGTPGVEEWRLDPIPKAWNPQMCEGCKATTCFETADGSPVDERDWRKAQAEVRAQIERKISTICSKQLQKLIKAEVEVKKSCGELPPGFAVTCAGPNAKVGPAQRFVVHICLGMLTASRCDLDAISNHELQHVGQFLQFFCHGVPVPEQRKKEEAGYKSQCDTWAGQCCLAGKDRTVCGNFLWRWG